MDLEDKFLAKGKTLIIFLAISLPSPAFHSFLSMVLLCFALVSFVTCDTIVSRECN